MMSWQLTHSRWLRKNLVFICQWLCKQLSARELGILFEKLQIFFASSDSRVGRYALEFNNPQALCFLIDAYPTLQKIFKYYPRMGEISFLDVGPAFGAAGGLLSQMHRSHFLGPKLVVDALDIDDSRKNFIALTYPLVNFIYESVEKLPENAMWDIVYCSNTIEHIDDPRKFIRSVIDHTKGHAIFLAPYKEKSPLSEDHRQQISEQTFDGFVVESMHVFSTPAWPTTAEGIDRQQIIAVLRRSA